MTSVIAGNRRSQQGVTERARWLCDCTIPVTEKQVFKTRRSRESESRTHTIMCVRTIVEKAVSLPTKSCFSVTAVNHAVKQKTTLLPGCDGARKTTAARVGWNYFR